MEQANAVREQMGSGWYFAATRIDGYTIKRTAGEEHVVEQQESLQQRDQTMRQQRNNISLNHNSGTKSSGIEGDRD